MTSERRNGNGRRDKDADMTLVRIEETVRNIDRRLDGFVTKDEFRPVRAVAYGLVGVLMSALIVVIVASAFG